MQKAFAIAVFVGLIWLGLTVFMEGSDAVLGRLRPASAQPAIPQPSSLERIRASGQAAQERQMERIERQIGHEPEPE